MKLRVKFVDNPLGFHPEKSVYMRALRKKVEVELSDDPQLLFYGPFGTEFLQYRSCPRVFLTTEPVIPNFNDCDYAIGPFKLEFGERYFRHPPYIGYGEDRLHELMQERRPIQASDADRRFCNFVYANAANGSGAKKRIDFCKQLSRYRSVDSPGQVLNNMDGLQQRYAKQRGAALRDFNDDWAEVKLAFLRDYKFTIAFENVSMSGWTTEKLMHPFVAGSVPIYWGNPDVEEYFNTKAMIRLTESHSMEDIVRQVEVLDQDRERYLEMLSQPILNADYPVNWEDSLAEFFGQIVQGDMKPLEKNPVGFRSMSAQDLGQLCREGKVGLSSVFKTFLDAGRGWLDYKVSHRKK